MTWTSNSSRSAIVWSANEKISFFDMLIWSKWIARILLFDGRALAHTSRRHAVTPFTVTSLFVSPIFL